MIAGVILSSICSFVLALGIGYKMGRSHSKMSGRKGILRYKWSHTKYYYNIGQSSTKEDISGTALCIVEEVDKLASMSEIKVLHIEDAPTELHGKIIGEIGMYWDTDDIEWDEHRQKQKETKEEKIIKTPLSELVKHVEADNIRDM